VDSGNQGHTQKQEPWMELAELAAREKDRNKLLALIEKIARLLDEKRKRRNNLPAK
jgi:hypothetical protein